MADEHQVQVHWHEHAVSRAEREQSRGHKGCVVWFTGQDLYVNPSTPPNQLPDNNAEDHRPRHRDRLIGYFSLTQFVTPLNGSAEATFHSAGKPSKRTSTGRSSCPSR